VEAYSATDLQTWPSVDAVSEMLYLRFDVIYPFGTLLGWFPVVGAFEGENLALFREYKINIPLGGFKYHPYFPNTLPEDMF